MKHAFFPALVSLVFVALAGPAGAHGPTPQKVEQTIAIAATPEKVWSVLKSYGDVASWNPLVASSKSSDGDKAGATRALVLKKGGEINEDLDEYDAAAMSYSYRLKDPNLDALPVSFYSATIDVKPSPEGALVEWFGRFYRGDTSNFPPDELNDEAAVNAMNAFMKTGLEGLKAKVEGKAP
ncbi:SRPBCC family protein [Methylocella sp.]|uniref:SRPBCC family protein n=1 Tax=Methylocella sp. TaxID=1978226 RepID=UPI0035ADEFA9